MNKAMSKLRVQSFGISIDGYGAGPDQDLHNPLGVGGPELMEWFFHTRAWRKMHGYDDGESGQDDEPASGRRMYFCARKSFLRSERGRDRSQRRVIDRQ